MKRTKSPGTPVESFTDWMGSEITVGTHVLVVQRVGDVAGAYSGLVLDINETRPAGPHVHTTARQTWLPAEYKILVEPTGHYSGRWARHDWPKAMNHLSGKEERTGERPRANWILGKNIVLSPIQEAPEISPKKPLDFPE